MVDILIIGCGIVGSLMAYELSKYDVRICGITSDRGTSCCTKWLVKYDGIHRYYNDFANDTGSDCN